MALNPNGRSLQSYPATWLSLRTANCESELAGLVRAALAARTVMDLTASPALFGGLIGRGPATTMLCSAVTWAQASTAEAAAAAVEDGLIEGLCGVSRDRLDLYFLRVPERAQPFQIEGAVAILEDALKEGHLGAVGVAVDGSADAARKAFLSDSIFQVALCQSVNEAEGLAPLIESRGGFVVTRSGLGTSRRPSLMAVKSESEVLEATGQVVPA